MKAEATRQLKDEGMTPSDMRFEGFFDIRYQGQEHAISTPVPIEVKSSGAMAVILKRFRDLHYKAYTFNLEDPTEVVNIRLVAFGRVKKLPPKPMRKSRSTRVRPKKVRSVYLDESGFRRLPVYSRDSIPIGAKIKGPAVIEEPTATTILRKGNLMTCDRYGNLVVEI
jgi:N-methylhydantoinase A